MKQSMMWRMSLACILSFGGVSASAEGDVASGAQAAANCLGCHGIPGYQNVYPTYKVPRLGGQNAAYIVEALKAYKAGQRVHKTMQAQASSLSDKDMQDVAAYFASLGVK
ncbi:MAG: cytochrome c [Chromatiales bacterium]|nr:cytochrome c [Chromatiales bacterium]